MKTYRILTIGNSFANNALAYLEDLAGSNGDVCFERLTGLDVRKNRFHPTEITAETAEFLRATAHEVCRVHLDSA